MGDLLMKKVFAVTLAIIMIFALAACGGGSAPAATPAPTPEPTPAPAAPQEIEGEFFPGLKDEDIPEDLLRKAGRVVSAEKVASNEAGFNYEVFIVLADAPMHFYSILSDHYNVRANSSELPLEEDQERNYHFDWGDIILSNKELLINEGEIHIHAFIK